MSSAPRSWWSGPRSSTAGRPATTTITTTATTGTVTTADGPPPKTLSVYATWEGDYRCRVQARHHELRIDEPMSAGGDDSGPQPTEVFLASLASCYALAIAHVARKRSMDLADVAVRAVGEYDGPRFVKVRVEVTSSHSRAEIEPLLARASAVCYVSNTLRAVDDVDVVLVDERGEA